MPEDETHSPEAGGSAQKTTDESAKQTSKKSGWEKADILLRAFATPLAVGIVGLLTSGYLNRQQTAETNQRAFTELVSAREDADTNLRRDMFKTVLDSFLKKGTADLQTRSLSWRFSPTTSTNRSTSARSFQDVLRRVDLSKPDNPDLRRLTKVASDVVFKQVEALGSDIGVIREGTVDFAMLQADPSGLADVIDEDLALHFSGQQASEHPARRFHLDVLARDGKRQELSVRLTVSPPHTAVQGRPDEEPEVDVPFSVGYFDFPDINNTRLSNGERCAVVIRRYGSGKRPHPAGVFPSEPRQSEGPHVRGGSDARDAPCSA